MKKTITSALALVALMTACHSTDVIAPRPATASVTTSAATIADDTTRYRSEGRSDGPATVTNQSGTPGAAGQPAGREGSVSNRSVAPAPAAGNPVPAVMPADTTAQRQ